jgi:hypothetical protein
LEEVPIFGVAGEEGAEPGLGAEKLVDVNDGEVALATGSDVETQTEGERRSVRAWERGGIERKRKRKSKIKIKRNALEEGEEFVVDEVGYLLFAFGLAVRSEFAELFDDLVVF